MSTFRSGSSRSSINSSTRQFIQNTASTLYTSTATPSSLRIKFSSPFSLRIIETRRTMATQAPSATTPDREILPANVIPRHYRLSLTPDFSTFKFAGKVNVDLDVKESTSSIILNALDLEFHSASVKVAGKSIASKNIAVDEEKQIATLDFEENLDVKDCNATLSIEFTGILNDKMAGFYRSSYVDSKSGETKWLATTQMGLYSHTNALIIEPTDARRAFPCWVEFLIFPY